MENIPNYLIKDESLAYRLVVPSEMVFISLYNGLTTIHFKDDTHLYTDSSIDDLEKKLSEPYFVRIHKSIIVNMLYAKNYLNHSSNVITLKNGEELYVQKEYRAKLFSRMLRI